MDDGVYRVLNEIESTETIGLSRLALSGLAIHRTWDVENTDDGNIVPFTLEFRRGDFDVGHEFASMDGRDCLNRKILVIAHCIDCILIVIVVFIKDLFENLISDKIWRRFYLFRLISLVQM